MHRLTECLAYFPRGDLHRAGQTLHHITTFHFHRHLVFERVRGANRHLDFFGGALADNEVVLALDVAVNGFVEFVAADAQAVRAHNAAERDYCDVGRAAANIDNHVAFRITDIEARADGRSHRL